MQTYVVGVDVGTGSARAAVFQTDGRRLGLAESPIRLWRPQPGYAEQSSEDIWRAVCLAVQQSVCESGLESDRISAIGFDATCSLVALDDDDRPVAINRDGDPDRNIIVWMDQRAVAETEEINARGHDVLKYVGGALSPEMETPKLVWLKRHLPSSWAAATRLMDLADFLTYRAAGIDVRSLCTTVCKWTYLGHEGPSGRWDESFFQAAGISDALLEHRIGTDVRPMGSRIGPLTERSATELGLSAGCLVGAGIIDAHAGGLGVLGAVWADDEQVEPARLESALALIGGTSSCHMAASRSPRFISGLWGPYFGAMVPGMWLTEGGQTTSGSAIDHVIGCHPHYSALADTVRSTGRTVYQLLNEEVEKAAAGKDLKCRLTAGIHVLPDFLGNRSPYADPHIRGAIQGITLDASIRSQALLYYAAVQAVAYGTRDIVRAMNEAGFRVEALYVTGGGARNPLWLQEHADATGLTLVLPREPEAVLLGSAILAATAAGAFASVVDAMRSMCHSGETIRPDAGTATYHQAKFQVFRDLYAVQRRHREMMAPFNKDTA